MLIDAHAHIDKYGDLADKALNETERYRIFTISNSMDLLSYQANMEIAEKCKYVLPAFGIHPWNAHEYDTRLAEIDDFINKSSMLGELGLDYYFVKEKERYDAQRVVLEYFLGKASEQKKIVNLHTRGAEEDILRLLEKHNIQRAIIHWYSGPVKVMKKLLDRGYYFTVGVEILFSQHIRKIAGNIPDELILTETDNPGGYEWLAGTPGMPGVLQEVVLEIAHLRKLEFEDCVDMIQANFERLIVDDEGVNGYYLKVKNRE
jgi:TatD DNase family protein